MKRIEFLLVLPLLMGPSAAMAQVPVPEADPIAYDYFRDVFWLWLIEQLVLFALPVYMLLSRRGAKIANSLEAVTRGRLLVAAALFCGLYAALYSLVSIPVGLLRGFQLNPYFRIPDPQILPWTLDALVQGAQLAAVAIVLGFLGYWLIRKRRRWWWAWASAIVVAFVVIDLTIQPLSLLSGSSAYVPLASSEHADWQQRIESVAARAGVSDVPVVVWQTTEQDFCRVQNSVTGLGPTRRVVLADQIFSQWTPEQVEVAFAHELKHYLFDNTWLPVVIISILSIAGALFVFLVGGVICRRWSQRIGFRSLQQPASLPLLVLLAQAYVLVALPAFHLTAQYVELEADRFALEITRENDARARVSAERCGRLWLPEDTLFARLYLNTHPSVAERIELANEYRPWATGEPLAYGDTIRSD